MEAFGLHFQITVDLLLAGHFRCWNTMPSAQPNGTSNGSINSITKYGAPGQAHTQCTTPLIYSGSLDSWTYRDATPVIAREFNTLQVLDLLEDSNSDQLIRDLAVTSNDSLVFSAWQQAIAH